MVDDDIPREDAVLAVAQVAPVRVVEAEAVILPRAIPLLARWSSLVSWYIEELSHRDSPRRVHLSRPCLETLYWIYSLPRCIENLCGCAAADWG